MLDNFCYMQILDEINPSLPKGELTIRRIAKHGSRAMTLIGWLMMLPFMILGFMLDKVFGNIFSTLIVHGVLKPSRYIFYQMIYWPLKIPLMIFSKDNL